MTGHADPKLDKARATAALTPPARKVHLFVLGRFAETGRPPSRASLDRFARGHGTDAEAVLDELGDRDVVLFDTAGEVRAAYPFSPTPTAIRVRWDGGPATYAMCAIDALGMSAMLDRPVAITAAEPDTGRTVTVEVDRDHARWTPASAVVFTGTTDDACCPSADRTCGHINFFTSTDAATDWAARHPDITGTVLGQPQALAFGIAEFGALLRPDSHDGRLSEMNTVSPAGVSDDVRPFRIEVPQADLDDLRERLSRIRWPDELPGDGWSDGVPLGYLKELADYWRGGYDWRAHEARLNRFAQFTTTIDGATVHFIHVRSPEPHALPLLMTNGWPSTIVDFTRVIAPLTDPGSHGGDPADAFHVVAPSIPGFAFSRAPDTGWNLDRITRAFADLMDRLGYARYGAHGSDFGSLISPELGKLHPDRVAGVHLAGLLFVPPTDPAELARLTQAEQARLDDLKRFQRWRRWYATVQATRPQTLAYALTDSPAGQLAWMVDVFQELTDSAEVPEDAVDRDQLLTNVSLFWLTGTAGSAARLFKESARDLRRASEPSTVPTGVAVFPREPSVPIRTLAEPTHNIVHWSEFDRGGHFPVMEVPDLLIGDIRDFFRRFR